MQDAGNRETPEPSVIFYNTKNRQKGSTVGETEEQRCDEQTFLHREKRREPEATVPKIIKTKRAYIKR